MKNKIVSFTVMMSLFILVISSCNKKDDEIIKDPLPPPAPSFLFKIEFKGNSSEANQLKGIIFLSDAEDHIIAESKWEDNSIIEFPLVEGYSALGSSFNVTIVYESSTDNIRIKTYLDISLGTAWQYSLSVSDNDILGTKDLLFENIPNHEEYCFSTDYKSKISLQPLSTQFSYQYIDESHDAILLLKSDNEIDKYLEINDVFNQTHIDLADMQLCDEKILASTSSSESIRYSITGFKNLSANCEISRYYLGGNEFAAGEPVRIEYPSNVFDYLQTNITQLKGNESWYQVSFGEMPDDISWLSADFEIIKDLPSDYQIQTEGTFDMCYSQWRWSEGNNSYAYYIHGSKDKTHLYLPKFSALVKDEYPNLSRDEFSLWYSMIIDYEGLNSYEELNKRFLESGECIYNNLLDYKSKIFWNSKDKVLSEIDILNLGSANF